MASNPPLLSRRGQAETDTSPESIPLIDADEAVTAPAVSRRAPGSTDGGKGADVPTPGDGGSVTDAPADGTGSAAESGPPDATEPGPAWLTDDVIRSTPERQVLVVGASVAGTVFVALLRRAGCDPVFLRGDAEPRSGVTCLWPSSLRLFAALGVERPVRKRGVTVDRVSVDCTGSRPTDVPNRADATALSVATPPVVVRTRDVRRLLSDRLLDGDAGRTRSVDAVSQRDGRIEVRFGDGVREWFDAVVDATTSGAALTGDGGRTPAANASTTPLSLTQHEVFAPARETEPAELAEVWRPDAFVQVIPGPRERGAYLRVTTGGQQRSGGLPAGVRPWSDVLPGDGGEDPFGDGEATVRHLRQADGEPPVPADWWTRGCVARCGPAGFPVSPASGLASALAVEDAWVLAEELTRGSRPVPDVLDAYARRRQRRVTGFLRDATGTGPDGGYPIPGDLPSPLSAAGRLRAALLASTEEARGITDRDRVLDRL